MGATAWGVTMRKEYGVQLQIWAGQVGIFSQKTEMGQKISKEIDTGNSG